MWQQVRQAMLRFATRPDKAFTETVTQCLELALGILDDESVTDDEAMACFYERLGVIFTLWERGMHGLDRHAAFLNQRP